MKAPHRMAGFSLVELMVAMVLGLLITAAAVSLFSTNQRTFALQQAMSESQEQGQLALRFIGQDLQLTGYVSDQVSTLNYPGVNLETFLGMPASADSANGTNDRLTISHHGRADCTGTTLTPAVVTEVANTYWVDDDGNLKIYADNAAAAQAAVNRVKEITAEIEVGAIYKGRVERIVDFGAFVNILPGKDGLVHISQISERRIENVTDELSEGQEVLVKVLDVDNRGRVKLSMKEVKEGEQPTDFTD